MAGAEEAEEPPSEMAATATATETERDVEELGSDQNRKDESMVGCYVGKKDDGESQGGRLLLGKVASFNPDSNLYSVVFENEEREDIDLVQLRMILTTEDETSSRLKMSCRKRKLDLLVSDDVKKNLSDAPQISDVSNNFDSSSNSCESESILGSSDPVMEIQVPELELPPSSGDLAVPEESAGHLFSVYNFLRSFSTELFLSPFTLNDFIGSLNCTVQNSLLDSVHLSLMKALRRHLESLSSDGSKLASKCLRYHDWTLLDTLTWPVFLLEFLHIFHYIKNLGGQKFGITLLTTEYYQLNISSKLKILQILCDEIIDSADLKSELEKHEEYSSDSEYDAVADIIAPLETPTARRGRPRKEPLQLPTTQSGVREPSPAKKESSLDVGIDGNSDECRICNMDGMLICCDSCPWAYHSRCIGLNKAFLPDGQWFCPECSIEKRGSVERRVERGARGAKCFGVDLIGRQFVGICDYLLVTGILEDVEPYHRYYNKSDVPKVLYRLSDEKTASFFADICKGISEYWPDIPTIKEESISAENTKGSSVILPHKDVKSENFSSGLVNCSATPQNSIAKFQNLRGVNVKSSTGKIVPTFRPHGYNNQYFHGEISASSAVTYAVISSEESNNSKSVESFSNSRKAAHHLIVLQMKAFSSAALQFVWPSFDRRQSEVPRERCGWCHACKGATVNKRGCLLNLAASTASKAWARSASWHRLLTRQDEPTHLPGVVSYLANMEESLQGLLEGELMDPQFRQFWREKLKGADNCRVIKFLLLELERCIRSVAMSPTWFKLTDIRSGDLSGAGAGGTTQRRGGGGGRSRRKRAAESNSGGSDDSWKEHQWWRGGRMAKALLQRLSLSSSLSKKAARQGGLKKISGVSYHDSSEYPKISRQFSWRASVDSSKSISHLALQVRYLNDHIRWKDLIPPDQIPSESKPADSESAVFRNAVICGKNTVDGKTIYALKFQNQKHLPVKVTKNIFLQVENSDMLWFHENHVPLYLIKLYEEKLGEKPLLNPNLVIGDKLRNFERKRLERFYDRHIFAYLFDSSEKAFNIPCASCHKEAILRHVVRCATCQGDCHETCMLTSSADVMCKSCHTAHLRNLTNHKMIQIRQTIPPAQQIIKKDENVKQVKTQGVKRKNPVSGDPTFYGLRWKKKWKNETETGMEFRSENIVLKIKDGINNNINVNKQQPVCCLCKRPYNSSLMYIRCEKCLHWFHADSVELKESQVSELVGFKCGKCRRKVQPKCPFVDNYKKPKTDNNNNNNINIPINDNISTPPSIQIQPPLLNNNNNSNNNIPLVKEDSFMSLDDPLLSSFGQTLIEPIQTLIEPIKPIEPLSLSKSNQKLSVRRARTDIQIPADSDDLNDVSVSSELQWDSSSQGADISNAYITNSDAYITAADSASNFGWNLESREEEEDDGFEPQTYFSFTELLAPDENNNNNNNIYNNNNVQFEENNEQIGAAFDELLSNSVVQEDEPMASVQVAICDRCKVGQPDRVCGVCGLSLHTHCSPWIDSDESFGEHGIWKCGNCREWK
ncbi:hypothetical protein LUZ60_007428 [Juncus effusus]|nr:hypothetical protein LUZ60_007428 [Juncus effusus]